MSKQVGRASLGWLCILAAALWIGYKHEYFSLLLAAWTKAPVGEFDRAAEMRLLIFILSPGILLLLIGIVMIVRHALKPRPPIPPSNGMPTI